MSASLVGSEMCIRDSAWAALRGQRVALVVGGLSVILPDGVTDAGGLEASVSYTHLTLPTICSV
eukprot:8296329-Alexandrium_andersonii.AAC.1